ncbi:MAG: SapC family protein [Gammaproteobacteria bacterium]|nr:SapC family protein [Gammaproteobacteria bacterium]
MASKSFYNKVVPLNRDRHRKLRLRMDGGVSFVADRHYVPLTAVEFYEAARDYPVVFAGGDDPSPLAMLGLRTGENLFVGADGRWADGMYIPAFVRRYPFILARAGETSDFTVCLDESYEGLSESEGTPLFDEQGKESEQVSRIMKFLNDFLIETERTRRFVERLNELGLLTVQSMQVQDRSGKTYALRDFRMVDEKKLKELDNEVLGELHRAGYLGCIYAHLVSLGNVIRLASRMPVEGAAGTADSGAAGSGTAEGGTAGSGTAEGGTADSGAAGSGTADGGTADSGTSAAGPA